MDSWHGNCGVTSGWSVWKRPISAIWSEDIEERPEFASVDVSFISLSKILPPAAALLAQDGEMVCLIKPQFEAGRKKWVKRAWSGMRQCTEK